MQYTYCKNDGMNNGYGIFLTINEEALTLEQAKQVVKAVNEYDDNQETIKNLHKDVDKVCKLNYELVEALKYAIKLIQSEYCSHMDDCGPNNKSCYAQKQFQALQKAGKL